MFCCVFNQEHWIDVQRTKTIGFNILIFDIIRPKMSVRLVYICIYTGFPFNPLSSRKYFFAFKMATNEIGFERIFFYLIIQIR